MSTSTDITDKNREQIKRQREKELSTLRLLIETIEALPADTAIMCTSSITKTISIHAESFVRLFAGQRVRRKRHELELTLPNGVRVTCWDGEWDEPKPEWTEETLPSPKGHATKFDESEVGGAFDGVRVTSDADPGL